MTVSKVYFHQQHDRFGNLLVSEKPRFENHYLTKKWSTEDELSRKNLLELEREFSDRIFDVNLFKLFGKHLL